MIDVPRPPRQLVASRFGVAVKNEQGAAATVASVRIVLNMPGMIMPPSAVSCVEAAPPAPAGYYVGVGTFTMTGTWRLDATAILPGGKRLMGSRLVQVH